MSEEVQDDGSRNSASLEESDASGAECATLDASTNISQTTISQMTASSVTATEGAKWCCHVCTYENFPLSRKCTMCRSPKSVLNEDIFRLQDGASALPTQDICGAEAVTERLKPLRISSPQGASASSVAKWPCPSPRNVESCLCRSDRHVQQPERVHPRGGGWRAPLQATEQHRLGLAAGLSRSDTHLPTTPHIPIAYIY
ncbi:hypothetical protein HF086_011815 [Spodoptera exigua]|uniref:RanBP2-type domain-containing protein n=1 Tax=Spodoptera exigua TaxID=7107 RepID=A0A922MXR0_SPOEX|nr:hypothetical protein HF086_011815 [Spodoptera exigua]